MDTPWIVYGWCTVAPNELKQKKHPCTDFKNGREDFHLFNRLTIFLSPEISKRLELKFLRWFYHIKSSKVFSLKINPFVEIHLNLKGFLIRLP